MIGRVKSIKLCYTQTGAYWAITIVDENGIEVGTFGTPEKSDSINFRFQTFGMMSVLNNMNLFNLGEQKLQFPVLIRRPSLHIESVANYDGDFLTIDKNANMSFGKTNDLLQYEDAIIVGVKSQSGVISLQIAQDYTLQSFISPNAYVGFKQVYDFNIDKIKEKKGADSFMYTICNIMKICNIKELLTPTNYSVKFPIIFYSLDSNGKIKAIGNTKQEVWLNDTNNGYVLSDKVEDMMLESKK